MQTVTIAGLVFGEGMPKICVPLMGGSMPELLAELQEVRGLPADLFEWRADRFFGDPKAALAAIGERISRPLLCTLRTKREGGGKELAPQEYEQALDKLLDIGDFQLLDIELSCGPQRVRRLVERAHAQGVGTVISRHDFEKTPPEQEMVDVLLAMKKLGGDLPKLAVTPKSPKDVLALLSATCRASGEAGPVITMSMGEMGKLSRVSGELFGSCLTFGAGRSASAPGQLIAEDLRAILEDISPHTGE